MPHPGKMKKIRTILILLFSLLMLSNDLVYAEEGIPDQIKQLEQKAVRNYINKDYKQAIEYQRKVLTLLEENFGPKHQEYLVRIKFMADTFFEMGEYDQSLSILRDSFGEEYSGYINLLKRVAWEYRDSDDFLKAIEYFSQALNIEKNNPSHDQQQFINDLEWLASLHERTEDYAEAISLYNQIVSIKKEMVLFDSQQIRTNLVRIARLYEFNSDFQKAIDLYEQILDKKKNIILHEEDDTEPVCIEKWFEYQIELAELYHNQGQYSQAKDIYKFLLKVNEKAYGPNHPEVAKILNKLAHLYHNQLNYSQAILLYKRSLEIYENALGSDRPEVADTLNKLAVLYSDQGLYSQAEPLYRLSLEIKEKVLDADHPEVATGLNNLALFYLKIGLYSQAKPLLERSLEIDEKSFGKDSLIVADSLNNLAGCYNNLGLLAKAESLYKRSLEIKEKTVGPEHLDVANTLNNLAVLYRNLGQYSQAESLYIRSLAIYEKVLGEDHPDVANSLNNLASLYRNLGLYSLAKPLIKRSLEIREKVLGTDHPVVNTSLINLASLYAATLHIEKAYLDYKRVLAIDDMVIDQVIGFRTEAEALIFLSLKFHRVEMFLNLINQHLQEDPSALGDGLDAWLRRKGIALEAQKRFQEALAYSEDPQVYQLFQELSQVKTRLSHMIFSGPGDKDIEVYRSILTELEKERSTLESRLVQLSQAFASREKELQADRFKVAVALPEDTALIEFARVSEYDFRAIKDQPRWLPDRYLAFILHSGNGEDIELIDLGPAETVDNAIALFREAAADKESSEATVIQASNDLYKLVFKPLISGLGTAREMFISPDGNLNLIPFEVLQDDQDRFLIEDYTFNYLYSGRQLLGFGQKIEEGGKALIMGDPDFEMSPDWVGEEPKIDELRSVLMELRVFRPLPGTREEILEISQIIGLDNSLVFTGAEATEENLFAHDNPSILHLATHGFFREDMPMFDDTDLPASRSFSFIHHDQFQAQGRLIMTDNPLLRSGLILAGANQAIRGETHSDQGIVTAEKILNLRLWGTDLVVLSACDTGMGDVRTGEGVFGLRRAFNQVGAKSLVMSMWKVPDNETTELMVNFYQNIYEENMNYSQALRKASLDQLEITRERYGHANPFYWGGFIFSGDPK